MKDNNHLILNLIKQVKSIGYQLSIGLDESKFVHIHGDETIFDFKTFTELVTAPGFRTPTGLSTQFLKADGSIDSTIYQPLITNPITGTGTANYIAKWSSTTGLTNSQIIDNGSRVLIGTTTDNGIDKLQVNGSIIGTAIKKVGGLSTQVLMADGSVVTGIVTGSGTSGTLAMFNGVSNLTNSPLTTNLSSATFLPWSNGTAYVASFGYGIGGNLGDYYQMWMTSGNAHLKTAVRNLNIGTTGVSGLYFSTNNVLRANFESNGNFLIGTSVDNGVDKLQVNSDATIKNAKVGRGSVATNLVFGSQSLLGATGADNTAIGDSVLKVANASATENVAVGNHAMENSTSSAYSTAIGAYALMTNTTGTENTAIGNGAMYLHTTGIKNVALGVGALGKSTIGNYNTAIGNSALQGGGALNPSGRVTGQFNIGVGFQSGRALTSGSNNILIENTTNDGVTTGSNNIIINPINRSGIITGNNNVVIGGMTSLSDTSDTMYFGTGSGVERMRIGADGNVLINTTTNNAVDKLQVNGSILATAIKKTGGTSSQFLKADGSVDTNSYASDANVLHKTGNESFTGTKSSTVNGTIAIDLTNAGGGSSIRTSLYATGSGYYAAINSSGTGFYAVNISGTGLMVSNVSTGSGHSVWVDNEAANTSIPFLYTKASATKAILNDAGEFTAQKIIKEGGLSTEFLMADGSVSTGGGGGGISGSGTTNYLPKFTSSTALGNSLIYDNGSFVGIGTTSGVGNDYFSISYNSSLTRNQGLNIKDLNSSANNSVFAVFRKSNDTYLGNIRRNSTDDAIYVGGNSYLSLGAGDSEKTRILANGNVLIGTTTDNGNKLEVVGTIRAETSANSFSGIFVKTGGFGASLLLKNSSTDENALIRFLDSSDNVIGQIRPTTNGIAITEGNVGIGTTTPSAKLTINNLVGGQPTYFGDIQINQLTAVQNTNNNGGLEFKLDDSSLGWGKRIIGAYDGLDDYDLHFQTRKNSVLWSTNLIVKGNGNVGVGKAVPAQKLDVNGSIAINGNRLYFGTTATDVSHSIAYDSGIDGISYNGFAGHKWSTGTGGVNERMRITNVGNLLIGTTTDNGNKLQVNGNITASAATTSNQVVIFSQLANTMDLLTNQSFTGIKSSTNTGSTQVNGISLTNNGTGASSSLNVLNSSTGSGIIANNSGTGVAMGIQNNSTGIGLTISNSIGRGIDISNTSSGRGINLSNFSTGDGVYVSNSSSGIGIDLQNSAGGDGITAFNLSTGNGVIVHGTSTGNSIVANSSGAPATGFNYVGQNNGINTYTVNKLGNVTGNSFIKSGGTASQFLMANGTVTEFKEYTAVFNTVGAAVTTNVLYNTIGAIVWSNVGTGRWQGVLTGAFPLNKCVFSANNGNGGIGIVNAFRLDDNTIRVQTYDMTGAPANDIISEGSLTVKVFP